ILMCTAGSGWYQAEGEEPVSMVPGTVIRVPAGTKHWHGAKCDAWFSHHAFITPGEDIDNAWLEPPRPAPPGIEAVRQVDRRSWTGGVPGGPVRAWHRGGAPGRLGRDPGCRARPRPGPATRGSPPTVERTCPDEHLDP